VERKGLPSAAELAELRPARCKAGRLKRLPVSRASTLFGACNPSLSSKPSKRAVSEVLRWPNRTRAPLSEAEHSAVCALCERCIEWAPSARPTGRQLVGLVAAAVRSSKRVDSSCEPGWVHAGWTECQLRTGSSLRQAGSGIEDDVSQRPCTPASNSSAAPSPVLALSARTPACAAEARYQGYPHPVVVGSQLSSGTDRREDDQQQNQHLMEPMPTLGGSPHRPAHTEAAISSDCKSSTIGEQRERSSLMPATAQTAATVPFVQASPAPDIDWAVKRKEDIHYLYYANAAPHSGRSDRSDVSDSEVTDSAVTVLMPP
jgi:hypothetical protein